MAKLTKAVSIKKEEPGLEPVVNSNPVEEVKEKTPQEKLFELVPKFKEDKTIADTHKKKAEVTGSEIKQIMIANNIDAFAVGDVKVTCTQSETVGFNQELLLATIKKLNKSLKIDGIVKKSEYVDMDVLEAALYEGKIPAAELEPCQTKSTTNTLRLGKVK